jgi:glycine oxidase
MAGQPDVVIVGAGVMGCGTAYWLSKAGLRVVVIEQESIACGASGMAAAMLESVGHGARLAVHDPLAELVQASFAQHQELARTLPEESGIDTGFKENPVLHPAFTADDMAQLRPLACDLHRENAVVQWLEGQALWELEPRLNRDVLGALVSPQAQVVAYRYVLALATAAERRGMQMRHGEVVGLARHGERVTGIRLRHGETVAAGAVVLAMGPWSQQAQHWIGFHVPVYPVRGQLLELQVPDPQLVASISYGGMYLVHKADGTTLAGTTEEHDSGFANHPTPTGRQAILEAALRMAPSLETAKVTDQVSGLRPCTADRLPLLGAIPGSPGAYMIAGHFRSGMLLSAMSTRIMAALIVTGQSPLAIDAFDPGRFGATSRGT